MKDLDRRPIHSRPRQNQTRMALNLLCHIIVQYSTPAFKSICASDRRSPAKTGTIPEVLYPYHRCGCASRREHLCARAITMMRSPKASASYNGFYLLLGLDVFS